VDHFPVERDMGHWCTPLICGMDHERTDSYWRSDRSNCSSSVYFVFLWLETSFDKCMWCYMEILMKCLRIRVVKGVNLYISSLRSWVEAISIVSEWDRRDNQHQIVILRKEMNGDKTGDLKLNETPRGVAVIISQARLISSWRALLATTTNDNHP